MPIAQNLPPPPEPQMPPSEGVAGGYIAHLLEFDRSEVRTNVSMNRYGWTRCQPCR